MDVDGYVSGVRAMGFGKCTGWQVVDSGYRWVSVGAGPRGRVGRLLAEYRVVEFGDSTSRAVDGWEWGEQWSLRVVARAFDVWLFEAGLADVDASRLWGWWRVTMSR